MKTFLAVLFIKAAVYPEMILINNSVMLANDILLKDKAVPPLDFAPPYLSAQSSFLPVVRSFMGNSLKDLQRFITKDELNRFRFPEQGTDGNDCRPASIN